MAVYTHLGSERLAELIAAYDVGRLVSAKGIAEGISNSNWLIETTGRDGTGARYVLTMYERRIDTDELPFFLGLLDHLAAKGCAVPATIHDTHGAGYREIDGKAVALIEFLPGVSPSKPTPVQARSAGAALADIHLAGMDFARSRPNPLTPDHSAKVLFRFAPDRLRRLDPRLAAIADVADDIAREATQDLPRSIIHTDLFPDNVLMLGDTVSGLIDFYFAAEGAMAYDLAVTHAAWSFDQSGDAFEPAIGRALVDGYESVRRLDPDERDSLPILAQAGCLRFVASRTEDWFDTPADALVRRKDPMEFVRRLEFYRDRRQKAFP
ncbi:homoserine kinase [Qipengyuania sp. MTN3-11]|uniref:homoserine kinase n=1 Tax=Qipengyuania sp. MTN3-11 TaxID=3056557 RepID=UPI0036F3D34E